MGGGEGGGWLGVCRGTYRFLLYFVRQLSSLVRATWPTETLTFIALIYILVSLRWLCHPLAFIPPLTPSSALRLRHLITWCCVPGRTSPLRAQGENLILPCPSLFRKTSWVSKLRLNRLSC